MATGAIQASVTSSGEGAAGGVWLERYAWAVVVYSVLVVLWGVVVRATGSGAGCGDHWPLCNGQVIPIHPRLATVIEYTHRMMSGPSEVPLIILLLVWVFRRTARHHLARRFAVAGLVLTFTEGLLGALLVKLGLTATSTSPLRPPMLALHLSNTLLLLGSLALTAHFLGRTTAVLRGSVRFEHKTPAILGVVAAMVIGITGSLAALGDTLFPATSLRAAFAADFSSSSEWSYGCGSCIRPARCLRERSSCGCCGVPCLLRRMVRIAELGLWLAGLVALQFLLGVLDVLLRAPVWMQVLHLAGADALLVRTGCADRSGHGDCGRRICIQILRSSTQSKRSVPDDPKQIKV